MEEVKEKCNGTTLQTEDVYMNTTYEDFCSCVIRRSRGIMDKEPFVFDAVSLVLLSFKWIIYIKAVCLAWTMLYTEKLSVKLSPLRW